MPNEWPASLSTSNQKASARVSLLQTKDSRSTISSLIIGGLPQIGLVWGGFQLQEPSCWLLVISLISVLSLIAWGMALHRMRAVRDTPTSKIVSAAQGYTELIGRGHAFTTSSLQGPLSNRPCLWYRYHVERKDSKNEWRIVESGESRDLFFLKDDTGLCLIDPIDANIDSNHYQQWKEFESERKSEAVLLHDDSLYAIGQFKTVSPASTGIAEDERLTRAAQEWAQTHQGSEACPSPPDINLLVKPQDGRLFLISNSPQAGVISDYSFGIRAHLTVFFISLAIDSWLLIHYGFL